MDARQAVQQTMDRMIEGYRRRDVDMIVSTYAQEAAYAAVPGEPAMGRKALQNVFEQIIASNPVFNFQSVEIVIVGNKALHVSAYEARMPDDGAAQTGLSIAVLEKQSNGEWLMVIDHPAGQRVQAG